MTLILARTCQAYSLMVSDRLVTGGTPPSDPIANKNLIFSDRNAVVAMGYTGLAYIKGVPTDQWLAAALTDLNFVPGVKGSGTVPMLIQSQYELMYWGQRVRRLLHKLSGIGSGLPASRRGEWREYPFDLLITGFEWNHGRVRPYLGCLSKRPGCMEFSLDSKRIQFRPLGNRFPVVTSAVPSANVSQDQLVEMDAELGRSNEGAQDRMDKAEVLLAELIRGVASESRVVGNDCMSILIVRPDSLAPEVRVRFLPAQPHAALLSDREAFGPLPIAYSPWVINSGSIASPCVLSNVSWTVVCGPYAVNLSGPPGHQGTSWITSLRRPQR